LSALRAHGEVEQIVLAVASAEELAQAQQMVEGLRAGAEDPLARAAWEDPRLAEGWRLFQAGQYDAAAAAYQQAQEGGTAAEWARYAFGRICQEQGKNAEALTAYQQALAVAPKHLPTLQAAAELHLAAGQPEKALPLLQTALEVNPYVATLHYLRGQALLMTGQTEPAIQALEQAAALAPQHGPTRELLERLK
jgi:tetratricopeptide (TPR) repeat protein